MFSAFFFPLFTFLSLNLPFVTPVSHVSLDSYTFFSPYLFPLPYVFFCSARPLFPSLLCVSHSLPLAFLSITHIFPSSSLLLTTPPVLCSSLLPLPFLLCLILFSLYAVHAFLSFPSPPLPFFSLIFLTFSFLPLPSHYLHSLFSPPSSTFTFPFLSMLYMLLIFSFSTSSFLHMFFI